MKWHRKISPTTNSFFTWFHKRKKISWDFFIYVEVRKTLSEKQINIFFPFRKNVTLIFSCMKRWKNSLDRTDFFSPWKQKIKSFISPIKENISFVSLTVFPNRLSTLKKKNSQETFFRIFFPCKTIFSLPFCLQVKSFFLLYFQIIVVGFFLCVKKKFRNLK